MLGGRRSGFLAKRQSLLLDDDIRITLGIVRKPMLLEHRHGHYVYAVPLYDHSTCFVAELYPNEVSANRDLPDTLAQIHGFPGKLS